MINLWIYNSNWKINIGKIMQGLYLLEVLLKACLDPPVKTLDF